MGRQGGDCLARGNEWGTTPRASGRSGRPGGDALVVHVARELQGNQGAPEHVAPGGGRGMWEQVWEPRLEVRVFRYGVRFLFPSTTSRIQGDLDVRVPRRSARARASVRRWPWSSRRGRSVQVKLIKMGGRLVRHSRRLIFQLSEVSVPQRLFQGVLDRIGRLSPAPN